jgi:hypothetical protein
MDGRELKSGGAEVFAREKVEEGNETSGWIAVCAAGREGGREGASVRGRIRTLVACPSSLKNHL